jgi:hypothetical protein
VFAVLTYPASAWWNRLAGQYGQLRTAYQSPTRSSRPCAPFPFIHNSLTFRPQGEAPSQTSTDGDPITPQKLLYSSIMAATAVDKDNLFIPVGS